MSDIINSNKYSYGNRSGSHATKGSARGVNLLGWGEEESLSLYDQRQVLLKRNDYIRSIWGDKDKDEAKKLKREYSLNNKIIFEIKKQMGLNNVPKKVQERSLGNYILDVVKERVTAAQWKAFANEGIRRLEEAYKDGDYGKEKKAELSTGSGTGSGSTSETSETEGE